MSDCAQIDTVGAEHERVGLKLTRWGRVHSISVQGSMQKSRQKRYGASPAQQMKSVHIT